MLTRKRKADKSNGNSNEESKAGSIRPSQAEIGELLLTPIQQAIRQELFKLLDLCDAADGPLRGKTTYRVSTEQWRIHVAFLGSTPFAAVIRFCGDSSSISVYTDKLRQENIRYEEVAKLLLLHFTQ